MLLQVSGSQLVVCVHMCIYGGGGRGNERDELMTICPLSCP